MTDDSPKRRSDGFLERGQDVTRTEAFVDAAFAFAVTVVVVRVFDGVDSTEGMRQGLLRLPGMLASFVIIANFWWAHQTWSRRYGLDDSGSVRLSLALVLLVGIYVYPLQMLFQSAFAFMSRLFPAGYHLPYGAQIGEFDELIFLYTIYGVAWATVGTVIALLYRQAWRARNELGLDANERTRTIEEIARWLMLPITGTLSITIAWLIPPTNYWMTGLPGFAYAAMALTPWIRRRIRRATLVAAEPRR